MAQTALRTEQLDSIDSESLECTVACRAYLSSSQSITNDSWTKVNFDTESFDLGSDYDTSNYRFTAPVSGYYQVSIAYEWDNTEVTGLYGAIYVNGSEYASIQVRQPTVNKDIGTHISTLVYCASGQYIEGYAYNAGTVAKNIVSSNTRTFMTIHLVGTA